MSIKNIFKLLSIAIITLGIFLIVPQTVLAAGSLTVTKITAVKTYADTDNTYPNGWSWIYDITVPTNETALSMKFANWTNGSDSIPVANNTRFYSSQSSNASDQNSAITINAASTYSGVMNLNPVSDLDALTVGIQIQITVEFKIPLGSANGSYSTTYGIQTNLPVMSGTVSITGTAKFGQLLTSDISALTYTPDTTLNVLAYQWQRDGVAIVGATAQNYTLVEADIGKVITVTVTADGIYATGNVTSGATATILKANGPPAPSFPTLSSKTSTSVILNAIALSEFSKDAGSTWQDSETFTGLTAGTEYTFIARVKETSTTNASVASSGINITTLNNYTIIFNENTGTTPANPTFKTADYNTNVGSLPTPPTKTGYTFANWNTQADGNGTEFTASTVVTANITVYAKWNAPLTTPTFSPNSGVIVLGVTTITLTSDIGTTIYYTTDGSTPNTGSSSIASGATITLSSVANPIKAISVKAGYPDSVMGTSGTYTQAATANLTSLALSGSPSNYTFAAGTYAYSGLTVLNAVSSITVTPTGSGTITVEGITVVSGQASGAIALTAGVEKTITVVTTETGKTAKTYTVKITRNNSAQTTPTFSPAAGAIAFGTTVIITSTGADAIYYTTDGSTPTTSSTRQSVTPLVISAGMTVKALAVRAVYDDSAVGSAVYTQAATANLTSLALSGSPSNYTFAAGTYAYSGLTVLNAVSSITVTPTGSGTITVEGITVVSGQASGAIALTAGVEKTITVIATQTGRTSKTYTIKVTRNVLFIGQNYQGGKVAYIDGTGIHGLIAVVADQSTGIIWAVVANQSIAVPNGTGTAIGTGNQNTINIVAQNGAGSTFAAGLCSNLVEGGYDDWYLPSKDELAQLYTNRTAIGGFTTNNYWSSSEMNAGNAWFRLFNDGYQDVVSKNFTGYVRAIRSF